MQQAVQPLPKLNIHKSTEDRHALLQFEGVIDEDFGAADLADSLSCEVLVIDLAQIKRITSFGIREWVSFVDTVNSRSKQVFLVDCAPRFVIQLNMVVGFIGKSTVLSVLAPYVCEHCGHAYDRRMDLLGNEAEVRGFSPANQSCESCGNEAIFDDDPARFFSYVSSQPRPNVQPDTAAFLARHLDYQVGQAVAKVRIAKLVEGRNTVLRLMGELNDTLPIAEVQEGLEGEIAVDLSAVTRATPSGLQQWRALLKGMVRQVDTVRLFGVTTELLPTVRELLQEEEKPPQVHSVKLPYRDEHATSFNKEVNVIEHAGVLKTATAPNLAADDGEGYLTPIAEPTTLIECSELPVPEAADEIVALVTKARQRDLAERPSVAEEKPKRTWLWIAAGSGLLVALTAFAVVLLYPTEAPELAPRAKYHEASDLSPPAWKDKHVYSQNGRITAVSQSTLSPDKATAFSEATAAGIEQLMYHLLKQMDDKEWYSLVGSHVQRIRDKAYSAHLAAKRSKDMRRIELWRRRIRLGRERNARSFGETSRQLVPPVTDDNYWESYRQGDAINYRVWAQVSVSEANFTKLKEHYAERFEAYGATVVSFFPLLCWELPVDRGAIAVSVKPDSLLAKAGLKRGDILLKVNDLSVTDGLSFQRQMNNEYRGLMRTGGLLKIEVMNIDSKRRELTASVPKSARPAGVSGPGRPKELPPANIWHEDPTQ